MEKRQTRKTRLAALLLAGGLGFTGTAQAFLIDRGGGLIYDTAQNITWLQDANYAMTNGDDADGRMTWDNSVAWVGSLSYYDSVRDTTWDDWRLPTIVDFGSDGCNYGYSGTDCGYNVDVSGSEMAHMYHNTLGNLAYHDTEGNSPQPGWNLINAGPFDNYKYYYYWSGTEFVTSTYAAWWFHTHNGGQGGLGKGNLYYAWAVRDGDVFATPIPAAAWLFGSGLIGLLGVARRRRTV